MNIINSFKLEIIHELLKKTPDLTKIENLVEMLWGMYVDYYPNK